VDFVITILDIEKQYLSEKGTIPTLLESVDIANIITQALLDESNSISTITTFLSSLSNLKGYSSDLIKQILTNESCAFIRTAIDILKRPSVSSEAVQLLLEFIFPIITANKYDNTFIGLVNQVLIDNKESILTLIKSDESILQCCHGVQLYCAIASYSVDIIDKELLWDCFEVIFKFPFSNTLHCLVTQTIVNILNNNVEDIVNMFLDNNEKFIDRIINEYEKKDYKIADFYPHLENMIKALAHNVNANNRLNEYPKWKDFISKYWDSINAVQGNDSVYRPSDEVMRAKERQIMGVRAGRLTPS